MRVGVRETKQRETRDRIAASALALFTEVGYEATTIDAIANAAGISRRLFFYYFKTKEDALLAWHGAGLLPRSLGSAIREASPDGNPLDVARAGLLELASRYETPESRRVDKILRSTESLRVRKDAIFIGMEDDLAEALASFWPDPVRWPELRTTAMIAIGTLRLALDDWREAGSQRSLHDYLTEGFDRVDNQSPKRDATPPKPHNSVR